MPLGPCPAALPADLSGDHRPARVECWQPDGPPLGPAMRAKALAFWANCNGDDDEGQRMADVSSAQSVNETLAGELYSANTARHRELGLLRPMSDPALRPPLSRPSPHPTKPGGS